MNGKTSRKARENSRKPNFRGDAAVGLRPFAHK